MADTLSFELVSPERKLASADAESVTVPGMDGDLTAMPDHAPFLTTLRPGLIVVRSSAGEERYAVTGGFAEIFDNTLSILAEEAVLDSDADSDWFDTRIAAAEKAAEDAGEETQQAARQRVSDFTSFRDSL